MQFSLEKQKGDNKPNFIPFQPSKINLPFPCTCGKMFEKWTPRMRIDVSHLPLSYFVKIGFKKVTQYEWVIVRAEVGKFKDDWSRSHH